jgi:hypothetical protein
MNNLTKVNIQQVLITQPIIDAALYINPILDTNYLSLGKDIFNSGFGLNRMENMMNLNLEDLLLKEPIVLKPLLNKDGKGFGKIINGKKKQLYEIIDGRHRVCRIILERMTELECIIL